MATDLRLDDVDGTFVVLDSRVVKALASDFMLDSPERRKGPGHRRALVHNPSDGLTINFAGDYPGGVTLNKVVEISPHGSALAVRGAITYETEQLTGAEGQGSIPGETHTITVNVDELFDAHQKEIVALRARIEALEARMPPA